MKALSLVVRKLWPRLKFLFTHHTPTRDTRAMTLAPRLAKNWPVFFDETFHNIYERMAILMLQLYAFM